MRIVEDLPMLHVELKTGEYSLLIANVALVGLESPDVSCVAGIGDGGAGRGRADPRVVCGAGYEREPVCSCAGSEPVPYAVRPFHLHDFLEKVSDLLVEVKAIEGPLRMTRYEFGEARKKKKEASRTTSMFASRDSYSYTEEELAEYERMESESSKSRRVKPRTEPGRSERMKKEVKR